MNLAFATAEAPVTVTRMMSTLDCISLFSTPLMTGSATALATARLAIEEFVASYARAPSGPLAALHELEAAVVELNLSGAQAAAVLADIRDRIAAGGAIA